MLFLVVLRFEKIVQSQWWRSVAYSKTGLRSVGRSIWYKAEVRFGFLVAKSTRITRIPSFPDNFLQRERYSRMPTTVTVCRLLALLVVFKRRPLKNVFFLFFCFLVGAHPKGRGSFCSSLSRLFSCTRGKAVMLILERTSP